MAFCMLGLLVLGSRLSLYSSFVGTMQTLFSVMLGKMDYYSVESAGGVLGPLMLFCFVLFFPNVMMFLAIFDDAFQEVIVEEENSSPHPAAPRRTRSPIVKCPPGNLAEAGGKQLLQPRGKAAPTTWSTCQKWAKMSVVMPDGGWQITMKRGDKERL
ncbi:hypothetical protein Bbelb_326990 [Branchiostoma belcheri]|nr:hypothetical protein Bbelb_326990 [Branchiostoma belcheri]